MLAQNRHAQEDMSGYVWQSFSSATWACEVSLRPAVITTDQCVVTKAGRQSGLVSPAVAVELVS